MFRVRDFMTKDPICVEPTEKISSALDLMRLNRIHRIPVVTEDDRLKGLITEGMIAGAGNSSSLSIYELNYLLSKTEVKTVMEKHPKYISQDALMEEATEKMLTDDIGCLPVVDDDHHVVGILTQNDIFNAFLDMLGWKVQGTRMIVQVANTIGALEALSKVFASNDLNISNISVYSIDGQQARILIKTNGLVPDSFRQVLEDHGYSILEWE